MSPSVRPGLADVSPDLETRSDNMQVTQYVTVSHRVTKDREKIAYDRERTRTDEINLYSKT